MCSDVNNKMLSYADDTSLYAAVPSPLMRQVVADNLTDDVNKIQSLWSQCEMKLNPSKTKKLRTVLEFPSLNILIYLLMESTLIIIESH